MTIEQMRDKKRERGYTYARISELSGVPLGTVQKIFTGETANPRYDTLLSLEKVFYEPDALREPAALSGAQNGFYTVKDYYALPDERRAELIDGYFYDMAAPTALHQRIVGELHRQIANYIMDRDGSCIPFVSPVDVQLDCDDTTMVQPDLVIVCDEGKVHKQVIYGAPDFVLEVVSPSTRRRDYTGKMSKYMNAGVREYWIVDAEAGTVLVYFFESETCPIIYGMDRPIPLQIYRGELQIQFTHICGWIARDRQEL